MLRPVGELRSCAAVQRHPDNPILQAADVPYPAELVFNAGVTRYQGRYVMVFRNDYNVRAGIAGKGLPDTNLGLAFSDDGVRWQVQPRPVFDAITWEDRQPIRAYDPRLTVIDGRCVMCFALDTQHGLRGGIAVTDDFTTWEVLSLSVPDNRNLVLFPERIDGQYVRLERPFPVYSRGMAERFDLWLSRSPDLRYWGDGCLVLAVEDVPFANRKIGPAAPPVKTAAGWLTTFHAVDFDAARGKNGWEDVWQKRYTTGIMLLDLDNPARVVAMLASPLLAPEAPYEIDGGFRNDVIFPTGMILEDDGEIKLYYGAADTLMCLATAHVDDLLALLRKGSAGA